MKIDCELLLVSPILLDKKRKKKRKRKDWTTMSTMDTNEQNSVTSKHASQTHVISAQQLLSSLNLTTTSPANESSTIETDKEEQQEEEDRLMDQIDDLICRFLTRQNRRSSTYRSLFRWTCDPSAAATTTTNDHRQSNLSYSVIVKIEAPSLSFI